MFKDPLCSGIFFDIIPEPVPWKARMRIVGTRGHVFAVVKAIGRELYIVLAWGRVGQAGEKWAEMGTRHEWSYTGSVP